MDKVSQDVLETFDNQYPGRDYNIHIVCPEFTSVVPRPASRTSARLRSTIFRGQSAWS